MENRIRVKEAIAYAKSTGQRVRKGELAKKMYPYASDKSAYMNLRNLSNGEVKTIDRDKVELICNELRVDPNFLFGWTE